MVVAVEGDDAFSTPTLAEITELSRAFEDLPGVRRVDSISTHPVVFVNSESALELDPALKDDAPFDADSAAQARDRARHDRIIRKNLVDETETTAAINLVLEANPASYYPTLLQSIEAILGRSDGPFRNAWTSGVPVFQQETSEQTRSEILSFAPLAVLAVALLVVVVYGSRSAAISVVVVGTIANTLMLSAIGMAGVPMSFTMVILPPVVIALAAAYGMHVLTAVARIEPDAVDAASWTREASAAIGQVAPPIGLSGLTTTTGFLASSLAGIDAVRYVGTFGAVGVLATTTLTLSLLPAFLSLGRGSVKQARGLQGLATAAAPRLARIATVNGATTMLAWGAAAAISTLGIQLVHVDTDATRWFEHGTKTRDDYERIRANLAGISPVNVVVKAQPELDSVLDEECIKSIAELSTFLEALPEVGKVVSVADPLIQIHQGFSGLETSPVPTGALAEQYLLLLESVDQIGDLISSDRSAANILVRIDNNGSAQILEVARLAEDWWRRNGPAAATATTTGVMFEFARAQDAIAWGQIVGLTAALAAIAVILVGTFRTAGLAVATFIPNAVPLLFIYGAMGTFSIPLDAGTVLVGSLALGIAVDDTIHVTYAYVERGHIRRRADRLSEALAHALPAITYTTVVVGAAFLLLGLSDFTFVRNLGLLMAAVMTVCLIADVSLLPTLLVRVRAREGATPPRGT